jgi:hypothetical protein
MLGKVLMNLIQIWTMMTRMVLPTNIAGEPILLLLLSASTRIFFGSRSLVIIIRVILFVFLLSSRFLRILQLCVLRQIHLKGLNGNLSSLTSGWSI